MFCPYCGNRVGDQAAFCGTCGSDLRKKTMPANDPVTEAVPVAEPPVEAAPVVDVPVEAAPVVEAPVEAAPVEAAPVVEAPVAEVPVEAAPVEAVPVAEAPVVEVPVEAVPAAEAPVEAAPVVKNPPAAAPAAPAKPAVKEPVSWNAYFLKKWKKFAGSPLVLVLFLSVLASQVLSVIYSPLIPVTEMLDSLGLPARYYSDVMTSVSISMTISTLASLVPGVLTAVALLMLFITALKGGPRLNTAGMTIIQVLQIIGLVGVCLAFGIMILLLVIAMIGMTGYYDEAKLVIGIVLGVIAAIGAFSIVCYAMILRLIKSVKTTMTTFVPTSKSAMFVGVLSIIGGIFSALGALISLSLAAAFSALSSILFGVLAISYKSFVAELADARIRMI